MLVSPRQNQPAETITSPPVFRSFSEKYFRETESWHRTSQIISGDGGCFGLYGPRGSGKTWLMLMAIEEATKNGGLGLWIPCTGEYSTENFLTALSDNLAYAIERRFARSRAVVSLVEKAGIVLAAAVAVILLIVFILFGVRGITGTHIQGPDAIYPGWVWYCVAAGASLAVIAFTAAAFYNIFVKGDLVREATALRERIRFSESLKVAENLGFTGGRSVAASLGRSRERTLSERQTSTATLVFNLRHLAEHAGRKLMRPLLICIDELDKINDPAQVAALLHDIRIICEVPRTCVIVSISEATATSLQAGALKIGADNELINSFNSLIALPVLEPKGAHELLRSLNSAHPDRLANALCLLAGGNQRELIRMADLCNIYSRRHDTPLDEYIIVDLLAEESFALLQQITRDLPEMNLASSDEDVKYRAWMALPREAFIMPERFMRLGSSAIRDYWEPSWASDDWARVREPWRRLLVRLFVAAKVLAPPNEHGLDERGAVCLLDDYDAAVHLRDILVMATRDSGVARLMLFSCFGSDLSDRYHPVTSRHPRRA